MGENPQQSVLFEDLLDKPVVVEFSAPSQSCDGGVVLLKGIDEKMGLTDRMAQALTDRRQPGKVRHALIEMLRERVAGIACGYPDANDAARLREDPAMQIVCERRDEALASQPTLSRFENGPTSTELLRLAYAFTDAVLDYERRKRRWRRVRRITIDLDPTEDPTHGGQQLTFFNAFYGNWCYLPMVTTIQFDEEPEHYLVAPVLRPGNAKGNRGAIGILKRLVPRLRAAFPKAKLCVRMDGGFADESVFGWLEAHRLGYVVTMARNRVLKRLAEPWMERVRERVEATGQTQKVYGEFRYQAGTWGRERRVIVKAEAVLLEGRPARDNSRFVVTNLTSGPQKAYRFYTLRGDAENRIKELKDGLRFDLTSCTAFRANQFRNLLTAAAYALYQQLRYEARGTACGRTQVWILRERLIKVAVIFRESVRRILLEGPRAYGWLNSWRVVAVRVGASP